MKTEIPRLSLVLPTYNERLNLVNAVERITRALEAASCSFEIIVVDDDSPDGTWKIAQDLAAKDPRVRERRRQGERGLATAVVAGWRMARGQVLGVMDADLQYPPETLPKLLEGLDKSSADVAICSRYAPGATIQEWSIVRWFVSWTARLVGRLLLPVALRGIADPGAGYFVLRSKVIEGVELRPRGYKILVEVLARGRPDVVVEVGLPYEGRKQGESKFRTRQVIEYLNQLVELARDTGETRRNFLRLAIGAGAMAIGLLSLWALTELAGLQLLVAALIAAEALLLVVYFAFQLFAVETLIRQRAPGLGPWHVRRIPALLVGLLVLAALTGALGLPYLSSAFLAALLSVIVDYGINAHRGR